MVHTGWVNIVDVQEATAHLSRLLERAEAGERIVIARNGRPVAQATPLTRPDLVSGGMRDEIRFDDDAFVAADTEVAAMRDERELG